MSPISQVVIDWSRLSDARGEGLDSFTGFVEWVRSAPHARAVHVVVPSLAARTSGRQMKNMLQALGCTVTLRTDM